MDQHILVGKKLRLLVWRQEVIPSTIFLLAA